MTESSPSFLPDLVGKVNTASDKDPFARMTLSETAKESSDLTGLGHWYYTLWDGVKFSSVMEKSQELGDR